MRKWEMAEKVQKSVMYKAPWISWGSKKIVEEKKLDKTPVRDRLTSKPKSPELYISLDKPSSPQA